jgi:hypothetical protein
MEDFPGPPKPPHYQQIATTLADVVRSAMTVGTRPLGLGHPPRALIEVCWRAGIVAANLADHRGRWVRSAAYERLDASEKSAVSYFMGMTQAEVTCQKLRLASHLVHVDAVWSVLFGAARAGRTRPDLVGVDASLSYSILVEAKGRSGDWDTTAIDKAKTQVKALTPIINMKPTRVASLAYFGDEGWAAWLKDPEGDAGQPGEGWPLEAVLIAYYRPLAAAIRAAGASREADAFPNLRISQLPGMDMSLGLPASILDILGQFPETGVVSEREIAQAGGALRDAVLNLRAELSEDEVVSLRTAQLPVSGITETASIGPDGVLVELGPSWYQPQRPGPQ